MLSYPRTIESIGLILHQQFVYSFNSRIKIHGTPYNKIAAIEFVILAWVLKNKRTVRKFCGKIVAETTEKAVGRIRKG